MGAIVKSARKTYGEQMQRLETAIVSSYKGLGELIAANRIGFRVVDRRILLAHDLLQQSIITMQTLKSFSERVQFDDEAEVEIVR